MDREHSFGSWLYDIEDQSRPLFLIRVARILLRQKEYWWSNPGPPSSSGRLMVNRPTGAAHRPSTVAPSGAAIWAQWCGVFRAKRRAATSLVLQSSGAVHGHSKAARVLKLGVRRRWVLLKLIGCFNVRGDRWKIEFDDKLGFGFWRIEIGAVGPPFYRGFVLML
jgi:hypothetical protein